MAEENQTAQENFKAQEIGKPFDFKNYQITTTPETQTLTIEDTKETFEVQVKKLSWARRNQILSKAVKWGTDGQTSFDGDAYVRMCLREMIVDAPWGKTTESFLLSIDERLGGALEEVVPKAFGGDDTEAGGLEQIDNLKDES